MCGFVYVLIWWLVYVISLSLSMYFVVFCMQIWIYELCVVVLCVLSSRMASDMLMIFDFDALLLQFDLKQNFAK